MNYLDVIIGILVIFAAIHGYKKGLVHQLASLGAVILGIFIAVKFSKWIAPFILAHFTSSANAAKIAAFVVIFIVVVILVHILGKFIEKAVEEIELAPLNRIAGLAFGVIKMVFILSAIMVLLELSIIKFNWPKEKDRLRSYLYKPVESVAPAIFPYLDTNGTTNNDIEKPSGNAVNNKQPD